jgi:hypothetical protein
LIINFLNKFKEFTSTISNINTDDKELHIMLFILSYIINNNLIDNTTLEKYLNGNKIYEVFKKKRVVLNELTRKYKVQDGGGFFTKFLKLAVVLSMFNTVEPHVNVEAKALTSSVRSLRLWQNNTDFVRPVSQLPNQDGRCALIQALISNPPEEAGQIITEFTNYYLKKQGFGWAPNITNPVTEELNDGKVVIERGFTEDFGNKEYVSIMGFSFEDILSYVKTTIQSVMDIVFSDPGYVDGQISMSLIGLPGHAETLLTRKHNGSTYYGILETNMIAYIDYANVLQNVVQSNESMPALYTVQPGFFTQEELDSMRTDLYKDIVKVTDNPIEDVVSSLPADEEGFVGVSLEMPNNKNPTQTHIPALVIPCTNGAKLTELGVQMGPIIEAARAAAAAAREAEDAARAARNAAAREAIAAAREAEDAARAARNAAAREAEWNNPAAVAAREAAYEAMEDKKGAVSGALARERKAREANNDNPNAANLAAYEAAKQNTAAAQAALAAAREAREAEDAAASRAAKAALAAAREAREAREADMGQVKPLKSTNVQQFKSTNVQQFKTTQVAKDSIPKTSENRFSSFMTTDEDDAAEAETKQQQKEKQTKYKRRKNKGRQYTERQRQRDGDVAAQNMAKNYFSTREKIYAENPISNWGNTARLNREKAGLVNLVEDPEDFVINAGGSNRSIKRKKNKNKTRKRRKNKTRKRRKNKSKGKRRNKSKTRRRN